MSQQDHKKWWVAHVRGFNYPDLRKKGFLVLYPDIDDYVFLEVSESNKKWLKKQQELSIFFIKLKSTLVEVPDAEIQRMIKATSSQRIKLGSEIEVISGYCENLEGEVLEIQEDQKLRVLLNGYNRKYDVVVDRIDVIEKGEGKIAVTETPHQVPNHDFE